jgi:imidazolonepropionase
MTTVIDHIGGLVTNDPAWESGRAGVVHDAFVVIEGDHIAAVGTGPAPAADERIDAGGRGVVPGFVDSHTHLVFAGDRSDEFAARMAGRAYEAGGIRSTVDATRAADDDRLRALADQRRAEARAAGITTLEIKSGYGLTPHDESRLLRIGKELTEETTFLGAHVVPAEFEGRIDDYVAHVCGPMLDACAPHARWVDAFCERGAFDADQCRAVIEAGRRAGLGGRLHANQLGPGPGVRLGVELDCASVDHCTYLDDDDVAALAASATVATFLPASDFSTRQPYPDARRVLHAGATIAIATNCNPGSSYTTSMAFCIALAVREMNLTPDEAVWAATAGGAAALRRDDVGRIAAGCRADLLILHAPSHVHFAYRPGVPLVAATIESGSTESERATTASPIAPHTR